MDDEIGERARRDRIERLEAEQRRLVHRLAEEARRCAHLAAEVADLKRKNRALVRSFRYRAGHAIALAARSPKDGLRLPLRLYRLVQAKRTGETAPLSEDGAPIDPQLRTRQRDLERFVSHVERGCFSHFVVVLGGTTQLEGDREDRSRQLVRVLLARGVPVLFGWRGDRADPSNPRLEDPNLLETPLLFTRHILGRLADLKLRGTRRVLVLSSPHPAVVRHLNRFNTAGWATLYDGPDEAEVPPDDAVGCGPEVGRFLAHNSDRITRAHPVDQVLRAADEVFDAPPREKRFSLEEGPA